VVHPAVTLDTRKQPIAVHNIHLPMPVGDPRRCFQRSRQVRVRAKYDESLRNAQIMSLLDILKDERLPYIVAGDFNMSDQSIIYGQLAAAMGDSFREAGMGFGASWPAGESEELPDIFPPLLRLDYVWHSPHFRAVSAIQGPPLGSDHLPLIVALESPGSAGQAYTSGHCKGRNEPLSAVGAAWSALTWSL
jgi:endonuclease/exonuclease/phosphatase family metal-dependent hydrolase